MTTETDCQILSNFLAFHNNINQQVTRENIRDVIKHSKLVHRWQDSEEIVVELATSGFEGLGLPEIYCRSLLTSYARIEALEERFGDMLDSVLEILEQDDYATPVDQIILGRSSGVHLEWFSEQFPDITLQELGHLREDKGFVLTDTYFTALDEQDPLPSFFERARVAGHSINTKFVRMSARPHTTN